MLFTPNNDYTSQARISTCPRFACSRRGNPRLRWLVACACSWRNCAPPGSGKSSNRSPFAGASLPSVGIVMPAAGTLWRASNGSAKNSHSLRR
jgi:hypothetical protein